MHKRQSMTGKEGKFISKEEAEELVNRYESATGAKEQFRLSKKQLQNLLHQPHKDIAGIRFYFGEDEEGRTRLIGVAADSKGNDIVEGVIETDIIS